MARHTADTDPEAELVRFEGPPDRIRCVIGSVGLYGTFLYDLEARGVSSDFTATQLELLLDDLTECAEGVLLPGMDADETQEVDRPS